MKVSQYDPVLGSHSVRDMTPRELERWLEGARLPSDGIRLECDGRVRVFKGGEVIREHATYADYRRNLWRYTPPASPEEIEMKRAYRRWEREQLEPAESHHKDWQVGLVKSVDGPVVMHWDEWRRRKRIGSEYRRQEA